MRRILSLTLLVGVLLSACGTAQNATPAPTPAPYSLNDAAGIQQFLEGWLPVSKSMGYDYEITSVSPEKDASGNVTAWVINARDPNETYTEGMCVVPIIGLSMLVKNYQDTGRSGQIKSIAPASLKLIRVLCADSSGAEKQQIYAKWVDVVKLGQGAINANRMLMQLTIVP